MGQVIAWAFLSALNPTLLAATTVMLLSPRPLRLMVGYWLGAMFISVTLGLVIVFALEGSSTVNTTKNTVSPIADFVLAAIFLVLAATAVAFAQPPTASHDNYYSLGRELQVGQRFATQLQANVTAKPDEADHLMTGLDFPDARVNQGSRPRRHVNSNSLVQKARAKHLTGVLKQCLKAD